jgi:hypothetical protein
MFCLRFARQEGIPEHFELPRVRLAFGAAKGIDRWPDTDIHEATVLNHLLPGCARQTTGNSGRPKINVGSRRRRHWLSIGDIGKLQVAATLQDPPDFRECSLFVRAQVDDAV